MRKMRLQNGAEVQFGKRLSESRLATVSTANSPYSEHIRSVHILITSGRGELWFSCLTQSVTVRTAKI